MIKTLLLIVAILVTTTQKTDSKKIDNDTLTCQNQSDHFRYTVKIGLFNSVELPEKILYFQMRSLQAILDAIHWRSAIDLKHQRSNHQRKKNLPSLSQKSASNLDMCDANIDVERATTMNM